MNKYLDINKNLFIVVSNAKDLILMVLFVRAVVMMLMVNGKMSLSAMIPFITTLSTRLFITTLSTPAPLVELSGNMD